MTDAPAIRSLRRPARRRGIAAVLAMMFLVIFASLAAAMAVVSQGNLRVADTNIKVNRSLAAAETGMNMMTRELERVVTGDPYNDTDYPGIVKTEGLIVDPAFADAATFGGGSAVEMWGGLSADATTVTPDSIAGRLIASLSDASHYAPDGSGAEARPRIVAVPGVFPASYPAAVVDRPVKQLYIPPVLFESGADATDPRTLSFEVRMTPHPLPTSEHATKAGYDDPYYDRLPYGAALTEAEREIKRRAGIEYVVGEPGESGPGVQPLDARFVRVSVTAVDGLDPATGLGGVRRTVSRDFRIDKRIPYAILSNSRLMIGRNVIVRGNVASLYVDTDRPNGNPVTVESDFEGLNDDLDDDLRDFFAKVANDSLDVDGDNRLNVRNVDEFNAIDTGPPPGRPVTQPSTDPRFDWDRDGDGFVSEFDFVLGRADGNDDNKLTVEEFKDAFGGTPLADQTLEQLFVVLDLDRDPGNETAGTLDGSDFVAKIRGEISTTATRTEWLSSYQNREGGGTFRDELRGTVRPRIGGAALRLGDRQLDLFAIDQKAINTRVFADRVDFWLTRDVPVNDGEIRDHDDPGTPAVETAEIQIPAAGDEPRGTPVGAENPYDHYYRRVYRNVEFDNVGIPVGSNYRFENCVFKGVTFIEIEEGNGDPDFNLAGMLVGQSPYPVGHTPGDAYPSTYYKDPDKRSDAGSRSDLIDTKVAGNNLVFHNCEFRGSIASGTRTGEQPDAYTHVRNKITFTGATKFNRDGITDPQERLFFERSSMVLPHVSVELGTLEDDASAVGDVELVGAIVAGVIDMRGQVSVRGTLIGTFRPVAGVAPVENGATENFNITLGYFTQDAGDLEAAQAPRVKTGLGRIEVTYDPALALPDGIASPIEMRPLSGSYLEGGR